ncbi:MAG: FtsQ-type POTRA domain-containing protein [Firmicutes bacterium]|nr:FtsQ-type POTRA domain-containing protein [Bacillota bacterium]
MRSKKYKAEFEFEYDEERAEDELALSRDLDRVEELTDERAYERAYKKRHKSYFWRNLLLSLFVLVLFCGGTFMFLKSDYFLIENIQVDGNTYYTDTEIKRIADAKTGSNIIFDAGIDRMEEKLEENPFFKTINIKRKLPSTIVIEVEERTQTAAIEFGDKYIIIDDEGVLLRMTDVAPKLTILTGLTVSRMDIGEALEAEEKENLSLALRMLKTMESGDIYFKKIDVSKAVIKAYIYDTLIVKGTAAEVFSSIESGDVQLVVSDLFEKGIRHGTIKMGGSGNVIFTPDIEDGD